MSDHEIDGKLKDEISIENDTPLDKDEIIEIEFINNYLPTVKTHYIEQLKPFVL